MCLRHLSLSVALLASLGVSGCASMTKQEQEVMQGQLARIDERIAVMSKSARMQAELTADFSSLRRSVLTMTGQIEEFNTRSQYLSDRLTRMEAALAEMSQVYRSQVLERSAATDVRLDTLSRQVYEQSLQTLAFIDLMEKKNQIPPQTHQRKVDAMRGADGTKQPVADGEEDADTLYQRSYKLFLAGDYAGADAGFSRFVSRFPSTTLAPNAAFWIGESRLAQKQHGPAAEAFDAMAQAYPESPKAPSALAKSAQSSLALGRTESAVDRLRRVIARYPDTEQAVTARQTLKSLGAGVTAPTPEPTPEQKLEPVLTPVPDITIETPTGDEADTVPPVATDAPIIRTPINE